MRTLLCDFDDILWSLMFNGVYGYGPRQRRAHRALTTVDYGKVNNRAKKKYCI
jgi:hypothetical protein